MLCYAWRPSPSLVFSRGWSPFLFSTLSYTRPLWNRLDIILNEGRKGNSRQKRDIAEGDKEKRERERRVEKSEAEKGKDYLDPS